MKNIQVHFQQAGGMLCLLTVIILLPSFQLRAQDYWEEVAQLPSARILSSVETVDNLIYIIGGLTTPTQAIAEVYAYNPATNNLEPRSPLPKALGATATAVLNGKIYLFGGASYSNGIASISSYVYDPATNQWASLADMPVPRGYAVAEAINGKIYLIGGFGTGGAPEYNMTQEYDPQTDSWQTKEPMLTARGYMCSVVLDNYIYVLGGGLPSTVTSLDAVEIYDPASNTWTIGTSLPTPLIGPGAGVLGKTIYVAGGAYNVLPSPDLDDTNGYSQETGWQPFAKLTYAMHGHTITAFEDNLYSFGGVASGVGINAILKYHSTDVGTNNPLKSNGLYVSPNPASERIIFQFENASSGLLTVSRSDGSVVFRENLRNELQHEFSVAGLPPGVYYWKWASADGGRELAGKVVVVK